MEYAGKLPPRIFMPLAYIEVQNIQEDKYSQTASYWKVKIYSKHEYKENKG